MSGRAPIAELRATAVHAIEHLETNFKMTDTIEEVYGLHRLQDHQHEDEFCPKCSTFEDMLRRLLDATDSLVATLAEVLEYAKFKEEHLEVLLGNDERLRVAVHLARWAREVQR